MKIDGTGSENCKFGHIGHLEMPILLYHKKCGEWPFLFATIVANAKIMLDIAALEDDYSNAVEISQHYAKCS